MCNCRTDIEAKLLERYREQFPEARNHAIGLDGYVFGVTESLDMFMRPSLQYRGSAIHPLKKGGEKQKKITGNMVASYCPFCGETLRSPEEQPAASAVEGDG